MSLLIQHLVGKRALIEDYRLTARKIIEVFVIEKSSSGAYVKLKHDGEFGTDWVKSEDTMVYEVLADLT